MNKCRILGWHFKFSQIKPLKHGFYLSQSVGNIDADMSGQHKDLAKYWGKDANSNVGGPLYANLDSVNATIYDGEISKLSNKIGIISVDP
jgi:hypothetical protein